jgi:hypothetical protein
MRLPISLSLVVVGLAAPALAEDVSAFADGGRLRIGGIDVNVGRSADRWTSARGGSIALDDNTFLFGQEDTYESVLTRRGMADPATGTTFGIGMKFRFDSGL